MNKAELLVERPNVVFRALSLGAGVQSTVMALLFDRNDQRLAEMGYERPDVAVFADTGWEPQFVYDHLDWLESEMSLPIERVSAGDMRQNLRRAQTAAGWNFIDVPLFVRNEDGSRGMLRRQCTNHYKVSPITRYVKQSAGGVYGRVFPAGNRVEMLLGISTDEVLRMKDSRENWVEHRWPLIDLGFSREDCLSWFRCEYPDRYLPRSACIICPFRSDEHWRELRDAEPPAFEEAVAFDRWMRRSTKNPVRRLLEGRPYLHHSRRPLDTALDRSASDSVVDAELMVAECEGMCGV